MISKFCENCKYLIDHKSNDIHATYECKDIDSITYKIAEVKYGRCDNEKSPCAYMIRTFWQSCYAWEGKDEA